MLTSNLKHSPGLLNGSAIVRVDYEICRTLPFFLGTFAEKNKYFHGVTVAIFPGCETITLVGESPQGVGARLTFSHSDASPSLTPTFDRVSLTLSESFD